MKRTLKPHGQHTVGWIICAACKANHKEQQVAILTRTVSDTTAIFVPDTANAALLRNVFGKRGHGVSETVWHEYAVADLTDSLVASCKRHGKRTIEVADVLAAIGTRDAPRTRSV